MTLTLITETVSLEEFYSGRKLMEPQIASIVAIQHSQEDLARLEHILLDTRQALDEEGGRFIKFSAIFHEELARMTRNKVVQHAIDFIFTMSPKARLQRFSQRVFREMVLKDHERIVICIHEGDGKKASREMERHLDNLFRGISIE